MRTRKKALLAAGLIAGAAADDEIKELIEFSYQLTSSRKNEPKRTPKR